MNPPGRPFLAWPGWAHLRFAFVLTALLSVWFVFAYGGADWLTHHRAFRVRIDFAFEQHIPLIPSFTLAYMSIYGLFLLTPFVLRTRPEIKTLARAQTVAILIAGICFLLFPAALTYPPASASELGIWKGLFNVADRLNLDYNLVPSLHVGLSIICIELFAVHARPAGKFLLRMWGLLIASSTLLTHQHHLLDVLAGYALALTVVWAQRRPEH
jgi:hypothetical protein